MRAMSWLITNFISAFLLPPFNLLSVAAIGLFLWHKRPHIAHFLLIISFAGLWLLSTPFFAEALLHRLEDQPPPIATAIGTAQAIVVLGGGSYFHAPEYGTHTVGPETLERLRYAATLHRKTGLPILVSGGTPQGNERSEAQQMQEVLEQEFQIPVRWREDASDNTEQNARHSAAIFSSQPIGRILLVTHAYHMRRARHAFERAGLQVIPAPTAYTTRYRTDVLAFLPNALALRDSRRFLHEWIGMLWYRLKSAS